MFTNPWVDAQVSAGQPPSYPFVASDHSGQDRNLMIWMPGDLVTPTQVTNLGEYTSHGTPNSFDTGWYGALPNSGSAAMDLNSGGSADSDYVVYASDADLTISDGSGNDRDFSFACDFYLRSYGLSNTGNPNRGRILGKDGVEIGFAANDLFVLRFKSSTPLERRVAPPSLNAVHQLVVTSVGNDIATDTKIYIDGVEPSSYTMSQTPGAGNYFDDSGTALWFGNAPFSGANGRLFDGLMRNCRLYLDRILTPSEVREMYDPDTAFMLFEQMTAAHEWPEHSAAVGATPKGPLGHPLHGALGGPI